MTPDLSQNFAIVSTTANANHGLLLIAPTLAKSSPSFIIPRRAEDTCLTWRTTRTFAGATVA